LSSNIKIFLLSLFAEEAIVAKILIPNKMML